MLYTISVFDTVLNNDFINSIWSVLNFIINLPSFILETLAFLPTDITVYLSTALIIVIALFIYRFIK